MLSVLEVAKTLFWSDVMFDRKLLPSEADLDRCPHTLLDLSTMSGQERISVFKECGIDTALFPLFLRALQHLTAAHNTGTSADNYRLHKHLSAKFWSPSLTYPSLLGTSVINSQPFVELCSSKTGAKPTGEPIPRHSLSGDDKFYVGLLNQGATCYLNSLMQTLFHLSAFRSIIYKMPTKEEAESPKQLDENETTTKSIPYALQRLFCLLQTERNAIGTRDLTASFGWSAADSFIQHDVHELTRVLIDTLAEKLNEQAGISSTDSKINENNALLRLFRGTLDNYVKVDELNFIGSREEAFYDLQLVVKNKKNIYESFDTLFQVEILDGKNKYCLEQDGQKSYHRAEKGARLKTIPPVLLLHLTRYDYDIILGETKVCTRWDYYNTLDLSKYMPDSPPEMTHYTLYSVFVHAGTNTGFGHYYCFIHSCGAWYKFNDETVTHASLFEVFGANFGGYRLNYWGTEVPHSSNAYMLVYLRTSAMETLLKPISSADIPKHVVDTLTREKQEQERLEQEKQEDYLYGRVHIIVPSEVKEDERYLNSPLPEGHKFSSQKTLRVLLEADALEAFEAFVRPLLYADHPEEPFWMWFASPREGMDRPRLHALVTKGMKVRDVVGERQECCLLVTDATSTPILDLTSELTTEKEYKLLHHKLYDPLQLKLYVLCSTVVCVDVAHTDVKETLERIKPQIRQSVSELPDESKKLYGHHLTGGHPPAANSGETPRRQYPTSELTVTWEFESSTLYTSDNDKIQSGDVLVWQQAIDPADAEYVFYPDVSSYQNRFVPRCISLDLKLNQPPHYPLLLHARLAEDMTYEQLQRYVARLVGVGEEYDRIRFTRHNPETQLPYFMKGKKRDRPTLDKLLTPASPRYHSLSSVLYYEYCKYTVTEIESAHSLQFRLFSPNVQPVSLHWILLSKERPLDAVTVFAACVSEVQTDLMDCELFKEEEGTEGPLPTTTATTTGGHTDVMDDLFGDTGKAAVSTANSSTMHSPTTTGGKADFSSATQLLQGGAQQSCVIMTRKQLNDSVRGFVQLLLSLDPSEAWEHLRLVDVWQGRIYNVFDHEHPFIFEHGSFEESAEYRLELLPSPLRTMPVSEQLLLQVQHFSITRGCAPAVTVTGVTGSPNSHHNNNNNSNNNNNNNNATSTDGNNGTNSPVPSQVYGKNLNANKDKVDTHSDPFSMYVDPHELPSDFLSRVADKLDTTYAAIQDWRVCLVRNLRVVEMVAEVPMGEQVQAFGGPACFATNQPEPTKQAFIGLEHAPLKRYPKKRDDKALILKTIIITIVIIIIIMKGKERKGKKNEESYLIQIYLV